jgi:hypothetical protein
MTQAERTANNCFCRISLLRGRPGLITVRRIYNE